MEVSVSTGCSAEVSKTGKVALTAKRLFDTVKSVPPGQISVVMEPNFWAILEADRIRARIAGSRPDDFPALPNVEAPLPITIPAAVLLDMIEKTVFSISTDEARAAFTGSLLSSTEQGRLQMVSTDGHRLSKIEVPLEGVEPASLTPLARGVIVPRKGIAEIRRIVARDSIISLDVRGDDLIIVSEQASLAIRLIPGRFPNFAKVIPNDLDHHMRVSRDALLSSLKRAGYYTAKTGNTRLTLSDGVLEIYAFDLDAGEFNERIPCEYVGEGVTAGFNYRYLLEVLNVIEADEVLVDLIDTESPTVIRDPARDEVLYIVMPMQL
jgi:DNA polymerase-3 subunit beta